MDQVTSVVQECGGGALAALERLRGETSLHVDELLVEVVDKLVYLRDRLVNARRAGTPCDDELRLANAILSSMIGLEFQVGNAQRTRIQEACDGLKHMLAA
jgi:hypothetical protein